MRLKDKVAIVTGGSGGQGLSHARHMCAEGAAVVLTDVVDEPGRELAEELAAGGQRIKFFHHDVADEQQWRAVARRAEDHFGSIDILVNNAGVTARTHVSDLTSEEWARAIAINQSSVMYGTQAVLPAMRARGGGSIINVSSLWAHTGGIEDGSLAYVATKSAVLGMTRNLALTLAQDNIRVNSISPGYIASLMRGEPDPSVERALARTPLGRLGTADEMSGAVLYLASNESAFTTGIDLILDGGLHLG
jgi:3alpha(or 20beta)-hydroxysteroid dehydrogenase